MIEYSGEFSDEMKEQYQTIIPFFDEDFYLFNYPELSSYPGELAAHYIIAGWQEGKNPTPNFSTTYYLQMNADVADAVMNPFYHYIRWGKYEGRKTKMAETAIHYKKTFTDKLCSISMVKNESDIIDIFCSHLSVFFDRIILIDHKSTDGTREYLKYISSVDPRFEIYDFIEDGYEQKMVMDFITRRVVQDKTIDWLFYLDADEFFPFHTRQQLLKILKKSNPSIVGAAHWINIIPDNYTGTFDFSNPFLVPKDVSPYKKVYFNAKSFDASNLSVTQGCHSLRLKNTEEDLPEEHFFNIYHIPVRSYDHIVKKLYQGVLAYSNRTKSTANSNDGFHWNEAYRLCREHGLSKELLNGLSFHYGEPVNRSDFPFIEDAVLLEHGFDRGIVPIARDIHLPSNTFAVPLTEVLFNLAYDQSLRLESGKKSALTKLEVSCDNIIFQSKDDAGYLFGQLNNLPSPAYLELEGLSDIDFVLKNLESATWRVDTYVSSSWAGHIPFMFYLFSLIKPRRFVELGTYCGASFFAGCQAAKILGLKTECIAIDTWKGDFQASHYTEDVFFNFKSTLESSYQGLGQYLRGTFDSFVDRFEDGSIDLLHIDGCHTYECVRDDFNMWVQKLSEDGIVLFHDTNEFQTTFGVWKFWNEIKAKYPSLEFKHSHGLGLIYVGGNNQHPICRLISIFQANDKYNNMLQWFFHSIGEYSRRKSETENPR